MSKQKKRVPLTPEQIEALTTTQHMRQAREHSAYWQRRSDAILKLPSPTPGQLERQPWFEQHALIWAAIAEKLDTLELLEAQQRARIYESQQ